MEKLRIVLSGIGNRTLPKKPEGSSWLGWVELIKRSKYFQLVGAHDLSTEAVKRIVERGYLNPKEIFTDLTTMLREVECDAVLICNPAEHHAATIKAALDFNRHALVEKPFVRNFQEGKELLRLIKAKEKIVAVVQNWRTKDTGRAMRKAVAEGKIGKVGHVFFRYVRNRENPSYPEYIFKEPYPLLYAMGIHHFDLFRYILQSEIRYVTGQAFKPSWSLYESMTGVNLVFKTSDDAVIMYSGTFSSPNAVLNQESFIIEGEKGTLLNESQWSEPPVWFFPANKKEKIDLTDSVRDRAVADQYDKSDECILENFYNSILGKEKPICSAEDGLQSLKVLEASRLSCETGQTIDVENYDMEMKMSRL